VTCGSASELAPRIVDHDGQWPVRDVHPADQEKVTVRVTSRAPRVTFVFPTPSIARRRRVAPERLGAIRLSPPQFRGFHGHWVGCQANLRRQGDAGTGREPIRDQPSHRPLCRTAGQGPRPAPAGHARPG